MSDDVKVPYEGSPASLAGKLLGSAGALGLPPSAVVFSPDGHFTVPVELAEHAEVSYELDGNREVDPEEVVVASESDQQTDVDPDAQVDADKDADGDDSGSDDADTEPVDAGADSKPADPVKVPQKGEEGYLAGKSLAKALKDRGLPDDGTADEKRARVAEYDANKE